MMIGGIGHWITSRARMPSWALLFMILAFGALTVFATTYYPVVRAEETRRRLANDARALLLPEIQQNSALLPSIKTALSSDDLSFVMFDITAWEAISKGGLLLGLEPAEITKYLQLYQLVYSANHLITQILDMTLGPASAQLFFNRADR